MFERLRFWWDTRYWRRQGLPAHTIIEDCEFIGPFPEPNVAMVITEPYGGGAHQMPER